MATFPPVTGSQNLSSKASPADWILETQTPGPDGKAAQHNFPLASGHAHTLVVQSGVQFKLSPAVIPVKDQSPPLALVGSVSHAKKGLDLQLMLPGGGSLVLLDFYAANAKAAPTKLQVTQLDGKEESVFSSLPKEAPATAEASVQGGDSKSSASPASSAVEPLPADQAALKAVKDGGKSKSKGKKITDDDSSWLGGFDGSWLGLLALGGLGGGGGGGGGSSGAGAGTGTGTGTGTPAGAVSYTIFGNIYAGPLVSNPGGDYEVQALNMAGSIVGSVAVNADGSYSMTMSLSSGDTSLMLRVHDKNPSNSDSPSYMDEATAELKTAPTMMAVLSLTSTRIKVNITGLTTLAAMQAGAKTEAPVAPSLKSIEGANKLVSDKFLLGEDILTTEPVLTINRDGSPNLAPNEYGRVLSRLSWLEQSSGMDPMSAIKKLDANFDSLTGKFSAAVQAELDQAKALVEQTALAVVVDKAVPTLYISDSEPDTAKGPVLFSLSFSEAVRNFDLSKLSITGGTAGNFKQASANQYTVVVTPNANSTADIVLSVAAGSVRDLGGNALAGTVSVNQTVNTVFGPNNPAPVADTVAPTLSISDSEAGTAKGPVLFSLNFSEPVSDFDLSKLSITGGTASSFKQAGANQYTVVVTPTANSTADIVLSVAAGSVRDLAGNALASAVSATQAVNTVFGPNNPAPTPDTAAPTLTISDSEAGTAKSAVLFSLNFSEPVSDFDLSKLSITGGTATAADSHTYALWNNGAAHLLIDQNALVHQVL